MFRTLLDKFERKSTVKTKLQVSFGLILLFTLIVGGISIYGYQIMGQSAKWLFVQGAQGISDSRQLQVDAIALDVEVNHLLLASTAPTKAEGQVLREQALTNIEKLRNELQETLQRVDANIVRSKTRVEFNELVEDFNIYLDCDSTCLTCTSNSNCNSCVDYYYLNGSTCNSCTSPCKKCSNNTSCISCIDNYYLSGNSCQS